jgi:hypothetical protein
MITTDGHDWRWVSIAGHFTVYAKCRRCGVLSFTPGDDVEESIPACRYPSEHEEISV